MRARRLSGATRRFFESVAGKRPLLLVFEDIHWAEPTLLDLIEYLADWVRTRPMLLLCLARPELLEARPGWGGGKTNAVSIMLDALATDEVDQMVEEGLGEHDLAAELRARIAASAHGVPLFVGEMIAMVDAG